MSGYLQRLFDRATTTPTLPVALPTGPSSSPVAAADQRLNDPAIAADFGFMAPADEMAEPADAPVASRPSPTATASTVSPTPRASRPASVPVPASQLEATPARVDPSSPTPLTWQPPRAGAVAPGDWVDRDDGETPAAQETARPAAQETARPAAQETARPAPKPAPDAGTERTTAPHPVAQARPHVPARGGSTRRFVADPAPVVSSPSASPADPVVGALFGEPAVLRPADDGAELTAPPPTVTFAEPTPPPRVPPLVRETGATPQVQPSSSTLRDTVVPPTDPAVAAQAPVPSTEPPVAVLPGSAPTVRPLTAGEVSMIGPLPPRRPPATLFGLRSR